MQLFGIFHSLLCGYQLCSKSFSSVFVLHSLGFIPLSTSFIGKLKCLAGITLKLLNLRETTVQLHLQLTLVTNHCRCLLGQLLMLTLGVFNSLLNLHLWISMLFDF